MRTTLIFPCPVAPLARSYWVAPGSFLAGFYPGDRDPVVAAAKLDALLKAGGTHVMSPMADGESEHAGRPFADYRGLLRQLAAQARAGRRPCPAVGRPYCVTLMR